MTAAQPAVASEQPLSASLSPGGESSERLGRLATLIIAVGAALRLAEYFSRFPLWADEARVALNVGRRAWLDLAQPLDHDQAAPIPFLWSLRLATKLMGMNELALRLVPLLAGLALLPLLWRLGRRWMGERATLVALGLAAASPLLTRYSNEVKQYSLDGLATLAALALAVRLLEDPASSRRWLWLALGGAGLVMVSHPIAFVLAGCGLGVLASKEVRAAPGVRRRWLAAVLLWLTVFYGLYLTGYRSVTHNPYMQAFWGRTYLDPTASNFGDRMLRAAGALNPLQLPDQPGRALAFLLALGFITGLVALARRRHRTAFVLLVGPGVAFGLASSLRLYPVADRLTLFLVPIVCLVIGVGVDAAGRRLGRTGRWLLPAALLVCGVQAVLVAKGTVRLARVRQTSRDLIRHYESRGGTDPVYVYAGGIPVWTFYTTDWSAPDEQRLARIASLAAADGPAFTNLPARGRPVSCEGDSLVIAYHGREELLGLGAGVGFVMPFQRWARTTDPGWAENEVRRMRETGHQRVWLMAIYIQDSWLRELLGAAQMAGAVPETTLVAGQLDRRRGVLVPLRFTSIPASRSQVSSCPPGTRAPKRDGQVNR